jgi:hypothetical protein
MLVPAGILVVSVLTANLPRDTLGRGLIGEESPDLKFEGEREDTRYEFRQVLAARVT